MGRDDAHAASGQFHDLYLTRSTAGEGNLFARETDEPTEVVCSLVLVLQLPSLEVVNLNAVLECNNDSAWGNPDGANGGECCDDGAPLLLALIP